MNTQPPQDKDLTVAFKYLYLIAGISHPTQQEKEWAQEAIMKGNPDFYVDKAYTQREWANKRLFEIKSLTYFMSKIHQNNIEAVEYFKDRERQEIIELNAVTSHPLFEIINP